MTDNLHGSELVMAGEGKGAYTGKKKGNSLSRLTEVIDALSSIRRETSEQRRKANLENSKLFFQW